MHSDSLCRVSIVHTVGGPSIWDRNVPRIAYLWWTTTTHYCVTYMYLTINRSAPAVGAKRGSAAGHWSSSARPHHTGTEAALLDDLLTAEAVAGSCDGTSLQSTSFTARRYAERGICYANSVRPSVTRVICMKTDRHIIKVLSLSDSTIILVFRHQGSLHEWDGFAPNGVAEYKG